jgi:hypothetical protein
MTRTLVRLLALSTVRFDASRTPPDTVSVTVRLP